MRWSALLSAGVLAGSLVSAAVPIPGDPQRGAEVFESQRCVSCHSINGKGGKSAPDLGKRSGRAFTPTGMAGLIWNHAPQMWAAMESQKMARPKLTEEQSADLFAFFYSARFFEGPGDAARGKQLFAAKRCADCHGLSSSPGAAPPVSAWESLSDPVALAQQMWNHSPQMKQALASKKIEWPRLTTQELTDILVYLQNLPQTKGLKPRLTAASAETGKMLFEVKGCIGCHKAKNSLENRFSGRTLTDFAVAMWNHASRVKASPLNAVEMRRLAGYLWSIQYFEDKGNAARGKQVYAKNCAVCHESASSGAPKLAGRMTKANSFTLVSMIWNHGPAMLDKMKQAKLSWPRLLAADMADLIAHWNAM